MNSLKKIMVVNDDVDVVSRMRERIPESIELFATDHKRLTLDTKLLEADVVILDNDANDRQEAKGPLTLKEIKRRCPDVPIIYSSFQPGWVAEEVKATDKVELVRTDQVLSHLAQRFGVELVDVATVKCKNPQLSLIISYNPVRGYQPDVYGNGKLLVVSFEKHAQDQAQKVIKEQVDRVYNNFEWRRDRDNIRNVFVYDGINGGEWPGRVAQALGHDVRMRVNLMACGCDWDRKERLRDSNYVDLYRVECGGRDTLGAIADVIMGIRRTDVNYNKLPISVEKIKGEMQKFRI